jgi:hypothetical protein
MLDAQLRFAAANLTDIKREGVKKSTGCHPERSEGSPQLLWFKHLRGTAEMLRCAQHDRFEFFHTFKTDAAACQPPQGHKVRMRKGKSKHKMSDADGRSSRPGMAYSDQAGVENQSI